MTRETYKIDGKKKKKKEKIGEILVLRFRENSLCRGFTLRVTIQHRASIRVEDG